MSALLATGRFSHQFLAWRVPREIHIGCRYGRNIQMGNDESGIVPDMLRGTATTGEAYEWQPTQGGLRRD